MQTKIFTAVLLSSAAAGVFAQTPVAPGGIDLPGLPSQYAGALSSLEAVITSLPTSLLDEVEGVLESAILPYITGDSTAILGITSEIPRLLSEIVTLLPPGAVATIEALESDLASAGVIISSIASSVEASITSALSSDLSAASGVASSGTGTASPAAASGASTTSGAAKTTMKTSTTGTGTGTNTAAPAATSKSAASALGVSVVGGVLTGLIAMIFAL